MRQLPFTILKLYLSVVDVCLKGPQHVVALPISYSNRKITFGTNYRWTANVCRKVPLKQIG